MFSVRSRPGAVAASLVAVAAMGLCPKSQAADGEAGWVGPLARRAVRGIGDLSCRAGRRVLINTSLVIPVVRGMVAARAVPRYRDALLLNFSAAGATGTKAREAWEALGWEKGWRWTSRWVARAAALGAVVNLADIWFDLSTIQPEAFLATTGAFVVSALLRDRANSRLFESLGIAARDAVLKRSIPPRLLRWRDGETDIWEPVGM